MPEPTQQVKLSKCADIRVERRVDVDHVASAAVLGINRGENVIEKGALVEFAYSMSGRSAKRRRVILSML